MFQVERHYFNSAQFGGCTACTSGCCTVHVLVQCGVGGGGDHPAEAECGFHVVAQYVTEGRWYEQKNVAAPATKPERQAATCELDYYVIPLRRDYNHFVLRLLRMSKLQSKPSPIMWKDKMVVRSFSPAALMCLM